MNDTTLHEPAKNLSRSKRKWYVISKKAFCFCFLFCFTQLFITYIFIGAGRDNEEYARLFEAGDATYLEPFWLVYSWLMSTTGISDFIQPTYGLFFILVLSAFFFFRLAISDATKWVTVFLILATVLSYQISLVTGALRQGVSFFLFSIFLLCLKEKYLFAAVATHVSGIVYLLFSRFFLVTVFAGVTGYFILGLNSFDFVDGALGRVSDYLEIDEILSTSSVVLFSTLKLLVVLLFYINYHYLKEKIKSNILLLSIIIAPLAQAFIYILIPNPIITDRANLLLDPFLLVGTAIIATKMSVFNTLLLLVIIIPKFVSRLYLAILQ